MGTMIRNVWRIVLSYVLVACAWIFFSDRLVIQTGADRDFMLFWSQWKGFAFVSISAVLLYVLIYRLTARISKASQAWQTSERKFRSLFERIRDGILAVDVENMAIFMVNPTLLEMLSYSEAELLGRDVSLLHPDDFAAHLRERFAMMRQGVTPPRRVIPFRRRDGSEFFAEAHTGLVDLDGRRYTITVFRDMTETFQSQQNLRLAKEQADQARQEAEKAREEAEAARLVAETANRAKDQFIALISHELRTPLTPALATVTALKEILGDPARNDLEVVRRNLELESMLIDDLLDITRITKGKIDLRLERTNLHSAIHYAVGMCKAAMEARGIRYTLKLEAANPYVMGDPPRLQQVFWNLLTNAVKFTPEGGQITIRSSDGGPSLRVEVEDNGIGFDMKELPRLFLPFEQGEQTAHRRFGGLGLGLSIAQNVTQLHQGTLAGFSEGAGKGSRFTVELPSTIPAEVPERATGSAEETAGDAAVLHILLVDDHADTLQVLARLLRRWGHQVKTANTVRTALKLAEKGGFDILISDLALPDGDGRDIMKELKAHYGLRGIALSGFGTEADRESSLAAGFEEHFVKPISFPPLRAALERIGAELRPQHRNDEAA